MVYKTARLSSENTIFICFIIYSVINFFKYRIIKSNRRLDFIFNHGHAMLNLSTCSGFILTFLIFLHPLCDLDFGPLSEASLLVCELTRECTLSQKALPPAASQLSPEHWSVVIRPRTTLVLDFLKRILLWSSSCWQLCCVSFVSFVWGPYTGSLSSFSVQVIGVRAKLLVVTIWTCHLLNGLQFFLSFHVKGTMQPFLTTRRYPVNCLQSQPSATHLMDIVNFSDRPRLHVFHLRYTHLPHYPADKQKLNCTDWEWLNLFVWGADQHNQNWLTYAQNNSPQDYMMYVYNSAPSINGAHTMCFFLLPTICLSCYVSAQQFTIRVDIVGGIENPPWV